MERCQKDTILRELNRVILTHFLIFGRGLALRLQGRWKNRKAPFRAEGSPFFLRGRKAAFRAMFPSRLRLLGQQTQNGLSALVCLRKHRGACLLQDIETG